MGSRIHREVYVRFRGEAMETYLGNKARRCGLSLQVNQVIADVAANVRTGWQFPPFFEWMRSEWNDVATPYFTNGEGDLKTVFDNWQKSSIDYGNEQGFTVE